MQPSFPVIQCKADGEWSAEPRQCVPFSCGKPPDILAASVVNATAGDHGPWLYTSQVEYRCNVGWNFRYPGYTFGDGFGVMTQFLQQGVYVLSGRRTCSQTGWLPAALPVCDVNQCSVLAVPKNGASISYRDSLSTGNNGVTPRTFGTVATYLCGLGFETRDALTDEVASPIRICRTQAEDWVPARAPACGPVDCGPLSDGVDNGIAPEYAFNASTVSGPTRYLATGVYRCKQGFVLPNGADTYSRVCSANGQWLPGVPTCVDVDECDKTLFGGKYFVNCAALYGHQSKCINTFGSYVCTPFIDVDVVPPGGTPSAAGGVAYNAAARELMPRSASGGHFITFAVNTGANLAAPYFSRVNYLNPDVRLYSLSTPLLYDCTNVTVSRVEPAPGALSQLYYRVRCALSAGQGYQLYVRLQFCIQPNAATNLADDVDCTRWNWAWRGTQDPADLATINDNAGLHVSYPIHVFVPVSLHALTQSGPGQRTSAYVSASSVGEDIGLDVENLYLERAELLSITYGPGQSNDDYPYTCTFLQELSLQYSAARRTIVCRTQDNLNAIDLKFRLALAGRMAYSTDTYSYPLTPIIEGVAGCPVDNTVSNSTDLCPTDGGNVRLTVAGAGFLEPLTAIVSGRQCGDIRRDSIYKFSCRLPPGTGSNLSFIVKAGSQRAESRNRVSYALPTIASIEGCEQTTPTSIRECSRLGGNTIRLHGDNFGVSGASVSIGGLSCTNVRHSPDNPHRILTCQTPADASVDRAVTVLQRYGEISREVILLSYVQCSPGFYNVGVTCALCEPGTFNNRWSQALCKPCSPGFYADARGTVDCSPCPAGTYSGLGFNECSRCARGTFALGRGESCTQCAPGTFAAHEGSSQCEACPLGAEHTLDYSYCQCKAGSYMDITGACQPCMPGGNCQQAGTSVYNVMSLASYSPSVSLTQRPGVVRVTAGVSVSSTLLPDDASRRAQAITLKALFDDSDRPRHRFAFVSAHPYVPASSASAAAQPFLRQTNGSTDLDADRDAPAVPPALPLQATIAVILDVVPPVKSDEQSARSLADDAVTVLLKSDHATESLPAAVNASYERFAVTSFELCLSNACLAQNTCLKGHYGPLCSVCVYGYGKTSVFKCAKCNAPALGYVYLLLACLAAILVCAFLAWKQIVDGRESMNELPAPAVPLLFKIALSGLQVMSIAARYDLRWPGFLKSVFDGADSAAGVGSVIVSLDCFLDESPAVKPFWVTSIGVMVLPLFGVLLPILFFAPRYFAAKRVYKHAVLEAYAKQRRLMAEMSIEYEAYVRTRDRLDAALLRRELQLRSGGADVAQVWEGVDDADDAGILGVDGTTLQSSTMDEMHDGINLKEKQNAATDAAFATKKRVARRARLKRTRHGNAAVSAGDTPRSGPLPPPIRPPPAFEPIPCARNFFLNTPNAESPVRTQTFSSRAPVYGLRTSLYNATPATPAAPASEAGSDNTNQTSGVFSYADCTLVAAHPTHDSLLSGRDSTCADATVSVPDPDLRLAFPANAFVDSDADEALSSSSESDTCARDAQVGDAAACAHLPLESSHRSIPELHPDVLLHFDEGPEAEVAETAAQFLGVFIADIHAEDTGLAGVGGFLFQRNLLADSGISEDTLANAYDSASSASTEDVLARVAREVELYAIISAKSPQFDAVASAAAIAAANITTAFACAVQSVEDLANMRLLGAQSFGALSDAELLRERVLHRERAVQRLRLEQQFHWYVSTYGQETGPGMYEAERCRRSKAEPPKLTAAEMRVLVDAAETNYVQAGSEYLGYIITTITVVMFMIHPNIVRQFFMIISCKHIGGTDDPTANVVLGDMLEPCFSSQHMFLFIVIGLPMLILWVIGIPFFAWFVLFRNRHLIMLSPTGVSSVMRVNKRVFESQMAFLYRGYRPTRYFWFLFEMARKAALVAIAVLFPGALHTQLLLAALLIFACIIAQIVARPFGNRIPEFAEFFSLFTSFMVFFLANFLFVDTLSEEAKAVVTVLICILVVCFIVIVVVSFIALTRDELRLAPLRSALRAARAQGMDTTVVIRDWRIKEANARRQREALVSGTDEGVAAEASPLTATAAMTSVPTKTGDIEALLTLAKADDRRSAHWFATVSNAVAEGRTSGLLGRSCALQLVDEDEALVMTEAQRGMLVARRLDAGGDVQAAFVDNAARSGSVDGEQRVIVSAVHAVDRRAQAGPTEPVLALEREDHHIDCTMAVLQESTTLT
jgi:hypothetical protein